MKILESSRPGAPAAALRRAKIVVTLGPATDGLERELVAHGIDVARLNFSHGAPDEHARRCAAIRSAAAEAGRPVAVMQDLQGPKIRVGRLAGGGPVRLEAGQPLTITTRDLVGDATRVSSTYSGLAQDVRPGNTVLLDDGRIRLTVTGVSGSEVATRVEQGGLLGEHKGINLPGVNVSAPALGEVDRRNLSFGLLELDVDYVALSFVRTAEEIREARRLVREMKRSTPLVVKLEKPEAIDHLEAILRTADAVMVARGDLGVELGPERVPVLQKTIIERAVRRGIPVITATQMLESMTDAEMPTRAEAADVANAVWDGSDALMLSGETAVGRHPLLVVEMMDRIIRSAEAAELGRLPRAVSVHLHPNGGRVPAEPSRRSASHSAAIARAASVLAEGLGARAIAALTLSGRTAHLISRERSSTAIYAFASDERVYRRLALWWGVTPVRHLAAIDLDSNIVSMGSWLRTSDVVKGGDLVVIVGGHPFKPGVHTNFVKFEVVDPPSPNGHPAFIPASPEDGTITST